VLRAGGSAVDACVAAAFASWIAEPALTGPGGGGFLVAYDGLRGRPLAIDCFVAVPGEAYDRGPVAPLEPYVVDFGTGQQVFLVGPGSCAVPGVTAGLEEAHRRLGRLPWSELARPAIELARAGVELTRAHADVIDLLKGFLGASPEGARVFGPPTPCAPATARATRRSERRWSASRPMAHASWPTARPPTRSSPTRPRREAA
jgi:gamma-glutamyltranspeptidase/glutathione hydrolase